MPVVTLTHQEGDFLIEVVAALPGPGTIDSYSYLFNTSGIDGVISGNNRFGLGNANNNGGN
jgi:hypothetical protein